MCVLGRSGLDFGRVFGALDMVLEVQNVDFSRFVRANEITLRKCSDPYKPLAGGTKIKVFYISYAFTHKPKNHTKSIQEPFELSFPQRSCSKLVFGLAGLDFGRVWGFLGRLLASF